MRWTDALLEILRSNHDVQLIEEDVGTMFYALKYATKMQHLIESMSALMMHSVAVRLKREDINVVKAAAAAAAAAAGGGGMAVVQDADNAAAAMAIALSDVCRGGGRCMSAARAATGQSEIQDTMACMFVDRGTRVVSSHKYAVVQLAQSMAIVNGQEHKVPLVRVGPNKFTGVTQLMDYTHRPESLAPLTYSEYTQWYFRVNQRESKRKRVVVRGAGAAVVVADVGSDGEEQEVEDEAEEGEEEEVEELEAEAVLTGVANVTAAVLATAATAACSSLLFTKGHPLRDKKMVQRRPVRYVNVMAGARLPDHACFPGPGRDKADFEDGQADAKYKEYAQHVLMMFKPFREPGDLVGGGVAHDDMTDAMWSNALTAFLDSPACERDTPCWTYMRHAQDYYVAQTAAQTKAKEARARITEQYGDETQGGGGLGGGDDDDDDGEDGGGRRRRRNEDDDDDETQAELMMRSASYAYEHEAMMDDGVCAARGCDVLPCFLVFFLLLLLLDGAGFYIYLYLI